MGGALRHAPVDDADHLAPTWALCGEPHLPAGVRGGLEHCHRVPAQRGHPRGLQPRRAGADDHHLLGLGRGGDVMRHLQFAARGRVVDAQRLAALVDPVEAIGGADAGPYVVLAPLHDLFHDMRLGDMGAGHADHVQQPLGDRVPGGGHVGDARGVEGGQADLGAHAPGEIQVRRAAHPLHRDHVGQRRVGLHPAADDVKEIDRAAVLEPAPDLQPVLHRDPVGGEVVGGVADTDDELGAHALAYGVEHVERECHPRRQVAVPGRLQRVLARRPEGVHQVAVGLQLDPVQPGRLHPLRGVGVIADDAGDVPILQHLGKGAVGRFAQAGGRHRRQPVALVPAGAPAQMGELDHHRAAVLVAFLGELGHPGHDLVLPCQDVVEGRRAVARDQRRTGGHGHGHAAPGAFHVIGAVAVPRQPVLGIGGFMRGGHDPVLQRQVLELIGLEQRIGGHGVPVFRLHFAASLAGESRRSMPKTTRGFVSGP